MNLELSKFIQDNLILDPTQFGFRLGHSTETAMVKATEEIRTLLDCGGSSAVILLDLSATFDTVDHKTLIHCLAEIGIKDKALSLLTTFLSDRTQTPALGKFNQHPSVCHAGSHRDSC